MPTRTPSGSVTTGAFPVMAGSANPTIISL
jgi:hypothetical protein